MISAAIRKAAQSEYELWSSVKLQNGAFTYDDETVKFTPPRNYTENIMSYRIVIASKEAENACVTINVHVRNEENPVIAELERIEQQKQSDMQQEQNDLMQNLLYEAQMNG